MEVFEKDEKVVDFNKVNIYQGKSLILSDVSFNIDYGEFVYLIGKTGSGKSSLLKTIYADLHLHSGSAFVTGFDLTKMSWQTIPYLRRKLGIVFQDFQLLMDRNIEANLAFVLHATGTTDKALIKIKIDEALRRVGLQTKGFKMPFELSGGEQQRIVIARAIINDPELIIADEPTGNLDPETSEDIMQLLVYLNKEYNTAVLMATHNYGILDKYKAKILRCVNNGVSVADSVASIE